MSRFVQQMWTLILFRTPVDEPLSLSLAVSVIELGGMRTGDDIKALLQLVDADQVTRA